MSDYFSLIWQSLDWSSIVLGLILAGLSALGLWLGKRRKDVGMWLARRREHSDAIRALPGHVADMTKNIQTLTDNNGRTTLQFTSINEQLQKHGDILQSQNLMLADISAMSHGQMELDSTPRFICDNDGRNRYVNTAYARMVGCGRDELDGFGYQRFFPAALNQGYMEGFMDASAHHRAYEAECVIVRPDGTRFSAKVRVVPHPEDVPPATHWNGLVRFLKEMPPGE